MFPVREPARQRFTSKVGDFHPQITGWFCPQTDIVANAPVGKTDIIGLCAPGCDVESFSITSQNWVGGWPSLTLTGKRYSKQLRTEFKLVLKPGADKKYCRIKQNKRGRVTTASGRGSGDFPSWSADLGEWWDGSGWTTISGGTWAGLTGTFIDEPGFLGLRASDFPVYFGSEIGPGFFDFNTYVLDASQRGSPRVAEVFWGLYIEYSSPSAGGQYYY